MNSAKLHLGEIPADYILQYIQKPSGCEEQLKWVEDKISHARDSFERAARPTEMVCDCYSNYNVCTGMPKSIFADKFGYDMQKDIVIYMQEKSVKMKSTIILKNAVWPCENTEHNTVRLQEQIKMIICRS